nr:hypothetical protein CFP56_01061 [Quercus suber]
MSSSTIRVSCLCGRNKELSAISSQLPVQTTTCSCDTCRYTSGVLYTSHLPLVDKPGFADSLTRYQTTRTHRYFCPNCGSHMLYYGKVSGQWAICAGAVEAVEDHRNNEKQTLQEFASHRYLADTGDGGIIAGLAALPGSTATFCMQDRDGPTFSGFSYLELLKSKRSHESVQTPLSSTRLSGSCHCGGVQYQITRPGPESCQPAAPWPDLILPHHSTMPDNPHDAKWWLRGEDRYLAGTCLCRSCRLFSGSSVQTWAFVPRHNVIATDGSPINFPHGTLSSYESSKNVYRDFCRVCGASVFWHCAERPDVIDISVGLLRAPEGAMASSWLEWWTNRVSYKEDALDMALGNTFEKSLPYFHSFKQTSQD